MADRIAAGYLTARAKVVDAGYGPDIDWAEQLEHVKPTPTYVVQETAWVILNSGFRYAVARKLWPALSAAFRHWHPDLVTAKCVPAALRVFGHAGKVRAMVEIGAVVRDEGIAQIVADAQDPPKLRRLPFIGAITCWHLAKVLGADVVKPDVHLVRAAEAAGYASPEQLCRALQRELGDRLTVVDSVLWRYGEQQKARGWPTWGEIFAGADEARA